MADVFLAVLAVIAGLVLCFGGQIVLRLALVVWGAVAGFAFGSGLVAALGDDRLLGSALGWVLGLVFGLVLGLLTNALFAFGVMLAMASFGFTLGSAAVLALGVDWSWVAVLTGVVLGLALGLVSVIADLPSLVLIVLSSVSGAVVLVAGVMLFTGAIDSADFTRSDFVAQVKDDWWYYALFVVVALSGVVTQVRATVSSRLRVHGAWSAHEPAVHR